jgi:putative membrane protein
MKKQRLPILLAVALTLVVVAGAFAQEDAHGRDVEEILQQIKQNQGVERVSAINPNEVDRELLEELGDGVMGLMIADEEQHEWMDRMMGGEGSTELASTHARLGYNYLQNDGNLAASGAGMMGFGMMGPGMMGVWNDQRGWNNTTPFGLWGGPFLWIGGLLVLVLLVALTIAIVRTRTPGRSSRSGNVSSGSALAILQARYARGELSQEEYSEMKTELQQ